MRRARDARDALAPGAGSVLPAELSTLGVGAGVARWAVGGAQLMADAWVGCIWPPVRPALRVQAGAAIAPFRDVEVSVAGFAANDRWNASGDRGVSVSLAYRFPR
jgi:hypothetical protein